MSCNYIVLYPRASLPADRRLALLKAVPSNSFHELVGKISQLFPGDFSDIREIDLWKVSGLASAEAAGESRQRIVQWFQGRDAHSGSMKMSRHYPLEHTFPQGTQTGEPDWVDIVVVTPEIIEEVDQFGDLSEFNFQRAKARVLNSRAFRGLASPSDTVKDVSTIRKTVEGAAGPRELAILKYDLDHLEAFTPNSWAVYQALRLVCRSTEFYPEEDEREYALQPLLGNHLPGVVRWQQPIANNSAKPYGVWFEGDFAILVLEIKNEQGLGGDPFLQSLVVYEKIIDQEQYAKIIPRSNLPIVLLGLAGNRLEVSTAIYTNAVYADTLLSIELMLGLHAQENVLRVARIFAAISKCMDGLRVLYGNLPNSKQNPSIEFPSPTPYPPNPTLDPPNPTIDPSQPTLDPSNSTPNPTSDPSSPAPNPPSPVANPSEEIGALKFFGKLDHYHGTELATVDNDNERHAIYLAKRSIGSAGEETVLVKFTPKYHEAAHRLLASQNPPLAPALHSCTRVIGGLYMVVMEYLQDAKPLYICFPPLLNIEAIRQHLTKALDLLHGQDLVFGDLREANVLYLPKDGGRALLIDFDGVGKHMKDRFSPCLNTELPLGVVGRQIMEKAHDLANLERLIMRLQKDATLADQS